MSSDHVIDLLNKNIPWVQWDTGSKSIFCLMFASMGDQDYPRNERAEARRLNVHLFNRYSNTPPEFIAVMLKAMPYLTRECMYPHASELRSRVLSTVPPRPIRWPSVD
jgi:hypothetical protein